MKKKLLKSTLIVLIMCNFCFTITSCSNNEALFKQTDYFINMFDTVYEHYDVFGSEMTDTSDGLYKIIPIGRLIIVKKNIVDKGESYLEILDALKSHYKNNIKVSNIFMNDGGTITIDCR